MTSQNVCCENKSAWLVKIIFLISSLKICLCWTFLCATLYVSLMPLKTLKTFSGFFFFLSLKLLCLHQLVVFSFPSLMELCFLLQPLTVDIYYPVLQWVKICVKSLPSLCVHAVVDQYDLSNTCSGS